MIGNLILPTKLNFSLDVTHFDEILAIGIPETEATM